MRFLSSFRRKRLTQHELRELFRRSEQGSSWPEVSPEAQEQFDADQQIIDQISGAASSVSPTDAPLQRGALLSRAAEARKARAEERVPMLLRRVPKRTVVIAGAVAILIMAAATVGATGSVGDVTDPVDDVLVAVQLKPHKVSVCHVPSEDPDNSHTISIGKSALEEHLAHGDSEGACADGDGKTNGGDASGKIDVCHVPEDNPDKPHTISIAEGALEEHLAHGDSAGACATGTP